MFEFISVCTCQYVSVQSDNYECVSALKVLAQLEIVIAFWTVMDETPLDTNNIIKEPVNGFKSLEVDPMSLSNRCQEGTKGAQVTLLWTLH